MRAFLQSISTRHDFHFLLQIKRKLPKVNRTLAKSILDNEDAENETNVDDNETKKPAKKKKALASDILKDERFGKMFENEVI